MPIRGHISHYGCIMGNASPQKR